MCQLIMTVATVSLSVYHFHIARHHFLWLSLVWMCAYYFHSSPVSSHCPSIILSTALFFLPTVTQVLIHCLLLFKHPKRATVFINSVNTMLQNYWNCFALCRLLSKLRHDGVTFVTHVILRMQLITATFLIQRKMGKHLTPFCVLIGDWDFRGFQSFL